MLKLRSDIKVELMGQYGTDLDIARAAWVSSGNDDTDPDPKRVNGVLKALMRDLHSTPFETGYFQFRTEAPRAVRDEMVRHRNLSFSAASLRYTADSGTYYIPPPERPLVKAEGFKQIQPKYEPMKSEEYVVYKQLLTKAYEHTEETLEFMRSMHLSETEMTRWITHDGTYTSWIARCTPRALMGFLSLRTHEPDAKNPSYPMWEIEQVARQMEAHFADKLPLTYAHWNTFGRVAL